MTVSDAQPGYVPNTYRIFLGCEYENGTTGPLLFLTEELFSFGIQENLSLEIDKETGQKRVTGYSMPLCLHDRDGATAAQEEFIHLIEGKIVPFLKDYLLQEEVRDQINRYELELSDLKKLTPLWRKREKGKIVEGRGPMLYPKLMTNRDLKIYSEFADEDGKMIDPKDLLGQKCRVQAGVNK
jgi:hypothetical protein